MTGLPCDPGAVTENWSVSQRVSPLDAVENTYELMEAIWNWGGGTVSGVLHIV